MQSVYCHCPEIWEGGGEYIWNEVRNGNRWAMLLIVMLVVGTVLFIYADFTIPDASNDPSLNTIAYVALLSLFLVAFMMIKRNHTRPPRDQISNDEPEQELLNQL